MYIFCNEIKNVKYFKNNNVDDKNNVFLKLEFKPL